MKGLSQEQIEAEVLRLPALSQEDLARRLGVKRHQVRAAYDALRARGELRVLGVGRGVCRFVERSGGVPSSSRPSAPGAPRLARLRALVARLPEETERRRSLEMTLAALDEWSRVAGIVTRADEGLVAATYQALPDETTGPALGTLIVLGAMAVPEELAEGVEFAAGDDAIGVLREAVAILDAGRSGGLPKTAGCGVERSPAERQEGPPVERTGTTRSPKRAPAVDAPAAVLGVRR